jgi:hypothetical protein
MSPPFDLEHLFNIRIFGGLSRACVNRRSHLIQESAAVEDAGELKDLDRLLVETDVYLSLRSHSRLSVRVDC